MLLLPRAVCHQHRNEAARRSLQNEVRRSGCDRRVRGKDAGRPDSGVLSGQPRTQHRAAERGRATQVHSGTTSMSTARGRLAVIPAWAWLAAIVALSAAIRAALAHGVVAPWIMVDELIYSELAKSVAAHGTFDVRGVPSHGYGFVYPLLIAPAFRIWSSVPTAYTAAKDVDSVVMSLAAL